MLVAGGVGCVPEVDVLDTSGGESLATGLGVPADVVNLVGITLLLHDLIAIVVEDVDLMFVVEIHSTDPSLVVDSDGGDATGTLGNLDSLLLLTGAGVPLEDGGLGADLSGDGGLALGADANAHNIIGVMVLIVGDVLGRGIDLTTTEELLGVGLGVQDDTEGGGHVDGAASGVPVDVLTGVSASVAIDVLEVVLDGWLLVVDGVVLIGLDDLSNPGADRHELLAGGFLHFEEVVLATVVVLSAVISGGVAGLLVVDEATAICEEFGVVGELAWCLSGV